MQFDKDGRIIPPYPFLFHVAGGFVPYAAAAPNETGFLQQRPDLSSGAAVGQDIDIEVNGLSDARS